MVSTTFAAVVLSAALANEAAIAPTWVDSYARATEAAVAQQKPLAVFIGRGAAGYTKVVGGDMPTEVNRLLAANYVTMYVNTDTAEGKTLASAFGVTEGLVISSRGARVQALKYGGPVPAVALAGYLTKYSAADLTVTTTEQAGTAAVVAAAPACPNGQCGTVVVGGCPNGQCGLTAPVYYPAGFSTCPNGRCPNAR